jgi:hypothetical protein
MQRQNIHVDSVLCLAVRKGQATHTRLMTNYKPHFLLLHAAMLQKYWFLSHLLLFFDVPQGVADLANSCGDKRAFGACLHGISEAGLGMEV